MKAFKNSIEARSKDLEERQKIAMDQLEERLKVIEWKDIRAQERQSTVYVYIHIYMYIYSNI